MDIEFFCPECGRRTKYKTEMQPFGKNKKCKGCGFVFKMSRETTRDATFGRIARTHPDWSQRAKALEELTDVNVVHEVLMSDREEAVRAVALRLIDEPAPIAHAARNDPSRDIRKLAIARIEDEAVLTDLYRTEPDPEVKREILARVSNDEFLAGIARNPVEQLLTRSTAIEQLNDVPTLQQLAEDADPGIQAKARQRLDEVDTDQVSLD